MRVRIFNRNPKLIKTKCEQITNRKKNHSKNNITLNGAREKRGEEKKNHINE